MCKSEVPCPCSKSQPGVRGQFKEPSGAFVTYCKMGLVFWDCFGRKYMKQSSIIVL